MTKEEIKAEIDRLRDLKFRLDMIDHWTDQDTADNGKISARLIELYKELENADKG